mmetsp:Transcript_12525/g.43828  ORF Transcript_12525/g.43828 Transcript_12525/m.43828 type:complete len:231 (-) Transcript_12525:184-876(-)
MSSPGGGGVDGGRARLLDGGEGGGRSAASTSALPSAAASARAGPSPTVVSLPAEAPPEGVHALSISLSSPRSDGDEVACRICGEDGEDERLIAPCSCAGSMRGVHASCLQKWIETRPDDEAMRCELCHQPYRVSFERQFVCDREHTCSFAACSQLSEACVLLFCLVCIVSMMFILPWDASEPAGEQTVVIVLFAGTTIFSLFVLRKVFQRWQAASSRATLVSDGDPADMV